MATTQADFARLHRVSRKTVTEWKRHGYLVMAGDAVDVEASNAKLAAAGKSRLSPDRMTGRTLRNVANAGGPTRQAKARWSAAELVQHSHDFECVNHMAVLIDCTASDFAIAVLPHQPLEAVQAMTAEFVATMRKGAVALADDDGHGFMPPGLQTWGSHPWFNGDPMTPADWIEAQAEAAAIAAGTPA